MSGQVNVVIGEARLAQSFQILIGNLRGCQSDLLREFQEGERLRVQGRCAKIGGELLDQLGGSAFETEKLSVQLRSILAAIGLGGHHCDHFSLQSCESSRIRHESGEQFSEGHSNIGADREQPTHVGHELGVGFGLADPPFRHLGISDLALFVGS